jgi:hypothetical protein
MATDAAGKERELELRAYDKRCAHPGDTRSDDLARRFDAPDESRTLAANNE